MTRDCCRCVQGNLLLIQEKVKRKEDFPLPQLGPILVGLRKEVQSGRGFALIRYVPAPLLGPTHPTHPDMSHI